MKSRLFLLRGAADATRRSAAGILPGRAEGAISRCESSRDNVASLD